MASTVRRLTAMHGPLRGDSTDRGQARRGREHTWHSTRSERPPRESVLVRRTSYRSVGGLVTKPNLNTSYVV